MAWSAKRVDGRSIVSGSAPPRAERVVVIDDRGDEYEATVYGHHWTVTAGETWFSEPLARFKDATGELVTVPIGPGGRTEVEDAVEPCPVCEAVGWIEVDERVVCERCGLEPGRYLDYEPDGPDKEDSSNPFDDDDDEEEEDDEGNEDDESDENARALAAARFPIYAVVGGKPDSFDHSRGRRGVYTVHVNYFDDGQMLLVETRIEAKPWARVLESLTGFVQMDGRDYAGLSDAAIRVQHADRFRRARRRVARAECATREFTIDGQSEPFAFIAVDDAWVATREHADVTIHLVAFKVDPATLALAPLSDVGNAPEPPAAERARRAAAGVLLSRAEITELIDRRGLSEHRDTILAGIRPGYRLEPVTDSPHRIGGLPDLAPGEQWPHDENGIPYTFVAQLDGSQLPPLESEFAAPEFGHAGQLLRFFVPMDGRAPEPEPARALACPPGAPLTRTATPPRPDPMPADAWEPDDDSLRALYEQPVRLIAFLTARHGPYGDADAYEEFRARLAAGGAKPREEQWAEAQLLGHATNMQDEDPITAGPWIYEETHDRDWCLLLNLPDHMSFGDGGALAILIQHDDLAAGRYDRLATDKSMG